MLGLFERTFISLVAVAGEWDDALALIAELAELAPDENLFADYLREDGSPSGFLKALGQREIAEALARNEVPPALLNPDSEAFRAFLQRREAYLLYP